MAHIHWRSYDPNLYNQHIPPWENYLLWFMGHFSGIPEFERYHFTSIDKSIERGIGLCGDASMLLSNILDRHKIENKIVVFPGHVVVELSEYNIVLDPDFGVVTNSPLNSLIADADLLINSYMSNNVRRSAIDILADGIVKGVIKFDGVNHFVTKKYYFERISYVMIWVLPFLQFYLAYFLYTRLKNTRK